MGSSTLDASGGLSIRRDQGFEAFKKAMDFWFPDPEAPEWEIISISPINTADRAVLEKLGDIPTGPLPPIWAIELREDGAKRTSFLVASKAPTPDEVMEVLWFNHYKNEGGKG